MGKRIYPPGSVCAVPDCDAPRRKRHWCVDHYARWLNYGDTTLTRRNGGDDIKYRQAHYRVEAQRGPAAGQVCIDCGAPAAQWSYRSGSPHERTGRNGNQDCPYSPDPADYDPRCPSCHKRYDLGR